MRSFDKANDDERCEEKYFKVPQMLFEFVFVSQSQLH